MNWLIDKLGFENARFVKALENAGHKIHKLEDYKYDEEEYQVKGFPILSDVYFKGSIENNVNITSPWMNDLSDDDLYDITAYAPYLGKYMLNNDYALIQYSEFLRQKWNFYSWFGKEAKIYIRPSSGWKEFNGGVLDYDDFEDFRKQLKNSKVGDDQLVFISSPKEISAEWRFVVFYDKKTGKSEILAQSLYLLDGLRTETPHAPKAAADLAKGLVGEIDNSFVLLDENIFIVDIGRKPDNMNAYYLIELNKFETSGLYACECEKIVKKIEEVDEIREERAKEPRNLRL